MKLLLSILLSCSFYYSSGQNMLIGKWYTFSSDMFKVIEYDFDSTIVVSNTFDWEMNKQSGTQITKIVKRIEHNGNLYYLLKNNQDTTFTNLLILSTLNSDSSFIQATTSDEHINFSTIQTALEFIKVDTFKRIGLTFFSEKEFTRQKSLPDPILITKERYELYLQELIVSRQKFDNYSENHQDDYGFMFFFMFIGNQIRTSFVKIGYNPIINDKHLGKVYDKFKDDIELKNMLNKAFKMKN